MRAPRHIHRWVWQVVSGMPGFGLRQRRRGRRSRDDIARNRISLRLEECERRELPGSILAVQGAFADLALVGQVANLSELPGQVGNLSHAGDNDAHAHYNGFMSPAAGHWLDDFFAQLAATAPRESRSAGDRFLFESSESTPSSTDAGQQLMGNLFQGGLTDPFTGDGFENGEFGHGGSAAGHSVAGSATSAGDSGGGSLSSSSSSSSTAPAVAAPPAVAAGIAASSAPAPAPTVVAGSPDPATRSAVTSPSAVPATTTSSSDSGSTSTFSSSSEPATADPIPPPPLLPPPLPIDPLSVLDAVSLPELFAALAA